MRAIVLAGGLGTRLAPVTGEIPKPLVLVGSRPFLEYLLDYLIEQGVEGVILAVSYKWEAIRDHFGYTYRSMYLDYSVENEPLGTGGAIRKALHVLQEDEVVVLNGDTLFPVDLDSLSNTHRNGKAWLSIAVKKLTDCARFGRVEVKSSGVITRFMEKSTGGPGWINGGVYMLNRRLFTEFPMPARFSFEKDLVERNVERIHPMAFFSNTYFIDIGVPEDYERVRRQLGGE